MRSTRVYATVVLATVAGTLFTTAAARADDTAPRADVSVTAKDAAPPAAATAKPAEDATAAGRPVDLSEHTGRFEFGSYGRISVASDLRGGTGRSANIVAYGPRVDADSYSELELRREDEFGKDIRTRVVTTLALFPPFFHFNGKPLQAIGVRNLYVQGQYHSLTMWAGSRMYRGDDIYLLNWWPLDNQNTMGGGVGWSLPTDTHFAVHVGMQRLDNLNQFQTIPGVQPYGFGATPVTFLDRPRAIETLKVTQFFRNTERKRYFAAEGAGLKFIAYGEAHQISAGVQKETDPDYLKTLPADTGALLGAQATYWTGKRDTYVSLFVRHARGLAAYDPLATPATFGAGLTTGSANETLFALGANYEHEWFGLLAGAYARFFRDGSPSPSSSQKYDEGAVVLRPQIFIGEHWGIGVEGSYQERRWGITNAQTDRPLVASLWRGALLPYWSPTGRGSFKRPQLGLVYVATARNDGARSLYPTDDAFSRRDVEHFFGILAEWWFNNSSYP